MFSTEQYASKRLKSFWAKANAIPSNALVEPGPITTQPAAGGTGSQPLKRTIP
jgi:hypothetical protein